MVVMPGWNAVAIARWGLVRARWLQLLILPVRVIFPQTRPLRVKVVRRDTMVVFVHTDIGIMFAGVL